MKMKNRRFFTEHSVYVTSLVDLSVGDVVGRLVYLRAGVHIWTSPQWRGQYAGCCLSQEWSH